MKKVRFSLLPVAAVVLMAGGCDFFLPPMAYNNPNDPNFDTEAVFPIPRATVQVDGDPSDWEGIITALPDPAGDSVTGTSGSDLVLVSFARDDDYYYCIIRLSDSTPNPNLQYQWQIYIQDPGSAIDTGAYLAKAENAGTWQMTLTEDIWNVSNTPLPVDPSFTQADTAIEMKIPGSSVTLNNTTRMDVVVWEAGEVSDQVESIYVRVTDS